MSACVVRHISAVLPTASRPAGATPEYEHLSFASYTLCHFGVHFVKAWLDARRARTHLPRLRRCRHEFPRGAPGSRAETIALAAQAWAGQGDAAATYNQCLAYVSSCFRYAIRPGLLHGENPIAHVRRQRVQIYGKAVVLTPTTGDLDRHKCAQCACYVSCQASSKAFNAPWLSAPPCNIIRCNSLYSLRETGCVCAA